MQGIAVEAVCSGERSKSDLYIGHSLFLKIRFFLLIRRRELSNSISLQKCFHQIKIPFRLNNEAHMTARNIVNLRIQFPEQICEPFLIFNRCQPARYAECFFSYTAAAMHQRMNCFDSSFFIFFASCS